MSEIAPTTVDPVAPGTGGEDPTATPPAPTTTPTATEDETITLKKKDYNNLVSARDRANNDASAQADFVNSLAKERDIDSFLESNKDKFPDLTRADLIDLVTDPSELEAVATRQQARFEELIQKKLSDVQRADTPVVSPEERAEKLKKLKENPGKSSFQEALRLKRAQ